MLTDVNHIAKVKKIMNLYFILPCGLKQKKGETTLFNS